MVVEVAVIVVVVVVVDDVVCRCRCLFLRTVRRRLTACQCRLLLMVRSIASTRRDVYIRRPCLVCT